MLHSLSDAMRGILSLLLYTVNTLFWVPPLLMVATARLLVPLAAWCRICQRLADSIANRWVGFNNWSMELTKKILWDVRGTEDLRLDDWVLVISNHQSWVDILVLQKIFHRKIPLLKFFLKRELLWVPFLGVAWWALDFPFMKRYSRAFLEKNPHLKGKDIEITRKACEKFKTLPVSVMNFVEGTRFSPEKHARQQSPFKTLLKPRAGGIAFVLASMGEQLHRILDVTIAYPGGEKGFWSFLCGRVHEIRVRVRCLPVTTDLFGDYSGNREFSKRFQDWLNALWSEKDQCLQSMLNPHPPVAGSTAAKPLCSVRPEEKPSTSCFGRPH